LLSHLTPAAKRTFAIFRFPNKNRKHAPNRGDGAEDEMPNIWIGANRDSAVQTVSAPLAAIAAVLRLHHPRRDLRFTIILLHV
jgi:hypothetical protein